MLLGFVIGFSLGMFLGGWFPFVAGCFGAYIALLMKHNPAQSASASSSENKTANADATGSAAFVAGGAALAGAAIASHWPDDATEMASDHEFESGTDSASIAMINPATGLPMLDGSAIDVGGNVLGCSNDGWASSLNSDSSFDSFSDSSFDDSSFSSFDDSW